MYGLFEALSRWYERRYAMVSNRYWTSSGNGVTKLVGEEQLTSVLEGIVDDFNHRNQSCPVRRVYVVGRVAELKGTRTYRRYKEPHRFSIYFQTDGVCLDETKELIGTMRKVPLFENLPYQVHVWPYHPFDNDEMLVLAAHKLKEIDVSPLVR